MVNYQLGNLMKYHGENMCRYNMPLRYNKKGTQIELKSKCRYHDRTCNRMVQDNAI